MTERINPWRIIVQRQADKDLARLPADMIRRAVTAIDRLADEPWPDGCRQLAAVSDTYRLRIGEYRVVYEVDATTHAVYILRVRHQREVYRRL